MLRHSLAWLFLASLAAGCAPDPSADAAGAPAIRQAAAVGDASAYPATYRDLELPILPGGVVTSSGRQGASLRDGLSIHVSSDRPVGEVRKFYDETLTAAGWTSSAAGPGAAALPNMPAAGVAYTRGDLRFSATITMASGGSVVSISVLER